MSEVKTYKPTHDMEPAGTFDSMPVYVSMDDYRKLEAERANLKEHNEYLVKTHAKIVSAFADKNNPHSAMTKIGKALGIYHEVNDE